MIVSCSLAGRQLTSSMSSDLGGELFLKDRNMFMLFSLRTARSLEEVVSDLSRPEASTTLGLWAVRLVITAISTAKHASRTRYKSHRAKVQLAHISQKELPFSRGAKGHLFSVCLMGVVA